MHKTPEHLCISAQTHTLTHTNTHTHTHKHTHSHTQTHTLAHLKIFCSNIPFITMPSVGVGICMYMYRLRIHTQVYFVYVHMFYVYIYAYAYICINIHMSIRIRIHTDTSSLYVTRLNAFLCVVSSICMRDRTHVYVGHFSFYVHMYTWKNICIIYMYMYICI